MHIYQLNPFAPHQLRRTKDDYQRWKKSKVCYYLESNYSLVDEFEAALMDDVEMENGVEVLEKQMKKLTFSGFF